VGEKLCTESRIGQLSCRKLGREPFFMGAVDLLNTIDNYVKG
jgi:hypothetical protein